MWANGDSGMLPADLRRGERYWRWSLGARPCRELGRVCPEPAGELGTLELGELLCDEFPPTLDSRMNGKTDQQKTAHQCYLLEVAKLQGRT